MCGIAGVFRVEGVDTSPVNAMARALSHRGPDAHTVRRYGGKQPYAALGVERLAIVDPTHGGQPASDSSGRWRVCLNGEIYNHSRIARELKASGVQLKTGSDTELIAQLIAKTGLERALSQCHGMFALAVLDTVERRLFLVRDRMGVKPLHWTQLSDGTIAWASELKGLLQHPCVPRVVDAVSVQQLLLFEYIPTPRTIWSRIHKVGPGTWIEADAQGVRHRRWWTPPVLESGSAGNFERWAVSLNGALQVAVNHRMEADVPIGYLLSGGIDSAAVTALAQRHSTTPIDTFSMQVVGAGFDESEAAAQTARALGTRHHTLQMGPDDLPGLLLSLSERLDEPLADSSLLPSWRLMEGVREAGFVCVLSGDGADESVAGYPTYQAHRLAGAATPARGLLSRLSAAMPVRDAGVSSDYMARRFTEGLGLPWARRHQVWMGAWLPQEIDAQAEVWTEVDAHAAATEAADPASRAMYLDQRMYLGDGVLTKVDRAAGAHGMEVRSPFLDHSVVELCAQMGIRHKLRTRTDKRMLREAMKDVLPAAVLQRKKKGFGAPVGPWLRGPCTHLLDNLPERVHDWIPADTVNRCISEHRSGTADHRRRLWSALILATWLEGRWGPG
jgi:asparagine synthase (glutamine-hydrolysing)